MSTATPILSHGDLTESLCIKQGVLIVTSLYYRVSLLGSLIVSTSSVIFTIYFIYKYYSSSLLFHRNLRMLFFLLSLCCISYDVSNIVMKVHHITISFLFTTPCEIYMSKIFYVFTSVPLFYSIMASQFTQMFMVAERWTATIFVQNYESGFRKLGPFLIATIVMLTACCLSLTYLGETFDAPQWYARAMPSTSYSRSNILILTMLILNFVSLILTIALYVVNRRQQRLLTLSSKFQSSENAIVSTLLFWISASQFTALFLAQAIGLYMRAYLFSNPLKNAYRENLDAFPKEDTEVNLEQFLRLRFHNSDFFNYYTLLLPILSILFFVKIKRSRIRNIRINLNMKSVGVDGWKNYSAMLQKQWM